MPKAFRSIVGQKESPPCLHSFFDTIAFFICFGKKLIFPIFSTYLFAMIFRTILFFVVFSFLLPGCEGKKSSTINSPEIMKVDSESNTGKVRQIFYNMYLPTEMARLFERVGANYDPKILNAPEKFSHYDTNLKIALNIGIYGVDLSYCRLFEQNAATAKYFTSVQRMYEKLGIPHSYYEDLVNGFEKYYSDKDSLAKFASEVYDRADLYLRENQKDSDAALVITGGWVEALYLSCKISEKNPDNIEIQERIAGQKYSLTSLISLLSNYQENIDVTKYILMLKGLKTSYDNVDIYYKQDNFKLDTLKKLISASDYTITLSPETLSEINKTVTEIRTDMVN